MNTFRCFCISLLSPNQPRLSGCPHPLHSHCAALLASALGHDCCYLSPLFTQTAETDWPIALLLGPLSFWMVVMLFRTQFHRFLPLPPLPILVPDSEQRALRSALVSWDEACRGQHFNCPPLQVQVPTPPLSPSCPHFHVPSPGHAELPFLGYFLNLHLFPYNFRFGQLLLKYKCAYVMAS